MSKLKIKHYIVIAIVFFSWFSTTNASVIINEVQISPTENRFIELYNPGNSEVNLTGWYIQRKTATANDFGSLVSKTYFKGISIKANGYLLISKTLLNNSDVIVDKLTLTKSNSIQIKNSNRDIVDTANWENIPEGKSNQKISSQEWIIGSPTPGEPNQGTKNSNINNNNNASSVSTDTSTNTAYSNYVSPTQQDLSIRKITAKIIVPRIIFAETPLNIKALITTNKKETLTRGDFQWNLGDGTIFKYNNSKEFQYTYFYPGDYVILLNYSEYRKSKPDASSRFIIKVIPSEVSISSVGSNGDSFIELENKSNYEISLSNWKITAGVNHFIIPIGTILLPHKKLKFSPQITKFNNNNLKFIVLTNPKGEIMTSYPIQIQKKHPEKKAKRKYNFSNSISPTKTNNKKVINLNDLGASAGKTNTDIPMSTLPYLGLIGIIIIGMASILLVKKKNNSSDYFKEKIRAEDITIIE